MANPKKKPKKCRIICWQIGRPPRQRTVCKKICKHQGLQGFLPKRISGFKVGG